LGAEDKRKTRALRAAGTLIHVHRHCEERSDEAIQLPSFRSKLDCFASLAMTAELAV
jgi:hypothetical protein